MPPRKRTLGQRTPRRQPVRETSQEIVEAIIAASMELIAETGDIESLTTNHVAIRAGVSVGSLYRYFPDKETIVAEIDLRLRREAAARLMGALTSFGDDLTGALERSVLAFLDTPDDRRQVRRALMRSIPLRWTEHNVAQIWASLVPPAAVALRRLIAGLDEAEARRRIQIALHAVQGIAFASVLWMGDELPPPVVAREVARLLAPYLVSAPRPDTPPSPG
jgi:AcrR family transcriptional regulator